MTQLPFLIGVDGSYPNVVAFVKDIETKGTKLALSQVQLSSSDGTTDKVSASIGVVAYVPSAGGATNG